MLKLDITTPQRTDVAQGFCPIDRERLEEAINALLAFGFTLQQMETQEHATGFVRVRLTIGQLKDPRQKC